MIDLCKIFGVEEGEEFKIKGRDYSTRTTFKIQDNKLFSSCCGLTGESGLQLNDLDDVEEVIKLPKKKEFTGDELCILRNIDKEYKWIARDDDGKLCMYTEKPLKRETVWTATKNAYITELYCFNHLFNSIQWEDEEAVFIDDYVERGAENEQKNT
jgi:hypothetical protein